MNTNVQITLNDEERNLLKRMLVGKDTKAMISRKEVVALCQQHIGGLLEQHRNDSVQPDPVWPGHTKSKVLRLTDNRRIGSVIIDPEDVEILAGKCESYARGWYQVKRSNGRKI